MASIIKLKRSLTPSAVPGTLQEGEIAVNLEDKKLFVGGRNGGSNTQVLSGDLYNLTTSNGSDSATITLTVDNDTLSNDAITIAAGEGIDVSESGGTITVASEDATTTNKGVASFATADFSVSSGAVAIKSGGIATAQIAADAVTGAKIADDAIDSEHLTDGSIDTVHISADAITGAKIADDAIDSEHFAAGSIDAEHIATGAVTSAKILDKTIVAGDIADGTITATQLASGAVVANTIGNNSVALGTKTTGNYVATVSGTANEIEVSGSGSETAGVTVGLPNDVTISNDLTVSGNAGVVGNVTIDGNLTVEGATTYVSSSTVNVDDSAIKLSANNSGDVVDQGMYGKYVEGGTAKYSGWHRDASDSGIIKWYAGLTSEPTTTVDSSHASYSLAQMDAIIDGGTY